MQIIFLGLFFGGEGTYSCNGSSVLCIVDYNNYFTYVHNYLSYTENGIPCITTKLSKFLIVNDTKTFQDVIMYSGKQTTD